MIQFCILIVLTEHHIMNILSNFFFLQINSHIIVQQVDVAQFTSYNSYIEMQFICVSCTFQWSLVYSQLCKYTISENFEKETL